MCKRLFSYLISKYFDRVWQIKKKIIIIILNISTQSLLVAGEMQALGVADMFCITGWLAIAFAKVCLFYSLYLNKHDSSLELQPSNNVMFNASWKGALWLDVGRFLVGFGIGLCSYAVTTVKFRHLIVYWPCNIWMTLWNLLLHAGNYISCWNHPQECARSLNVGDACTYLNDFLFHLRINE